MTVEAHQQQPSGQELNAPGAIENVALSAMVDGELAVGEVDGLFQGNESPAEALSSWHAYQVIGDVLRGNADPTGPVPASDFLTTFRSRLQVQASGPVLASGGDGAVPTAQLAAANDPVFRWKLVAGFASLAAVMAVSWSLVAGLGVGGSATGAQLASTAAPHVVGSPVSPTEVVATALQPAASPVQIDSAQGIVLRDPQLEALMAEHRQHGGMSALQTSSGFIRNATYDAAER